MSASDHVGKSKPAACKEAAQRGSVSGRKGHCGRGPAGPVPSGEAARLRANAAAQKSWELNANQQVTFAIFREARQTKQRPSGCAHGRHGRGNPSVSKTYRDILHQNGLNQKFRLSGQPLRRREDKNQASLGLPVASYAAKNPRCFKHPCQIQSIHLCIPTGSNGNLKPKTPSSRP